MKKETNTQNLNTLMTSLGADFEAILAKAKERREKARPRLEAIYGTLSDKAIDKILRAQSELELCKDCDGNCRTAQQNYRKPVIERDGFVTGALCKYGMAARLKRKGETAKIPLQYLGKTFADYEVTPDNAEAVKIAKWFVAEKPPKSLYFYGKCGTGKTFLASIIAQGLIGDGKRVIFGDVPTLLEDLKREFNGGDANRVLGSYNACDLLVLDDLGAGQLSEWGVGIIYQVINARCNADKRLIVTSNFDYRGLEARLKSKDAFSAERIISRLIGMCIPAFLGTKDRRKARC